MKAQMSIGREYDCKYDWNCFCQAGEHGVVFSSKGNYSTAFFEAFPKKPKCFLRGEGKTVEEAEAECWQKYQKVITCNHEMERRHRTDGYAYCKHCDYSAMVFEPLTRCCKCGVHTAYAKDIRGKYFCKKCSHTIPRKYMDDWDPNKKAKRRLPRKLKKMVKQGASIRLYQTHRYEKVTFKYYLDLELSGNGKGFYSLSPKSIIRRCIEALKKDKKNHHERNPRNTSEKRSRKLGRVLHPTAHHRGVRSLRPRPCHTAQSAMANRRRDVHKER